MELERVPPILEAEIAAIVGPNGNLAAAAPDIFRALSSCHGQTFTVAVRHHIGWDVLAFVGEVRMPPGFDGQILVVSVPFPEAEIPPLQ